MHNLILIQMEQTDFEYLTQTNLASSCSYDDPVDDKLSRPLPRLPVVIVQRNFLFGSDVHRHLLLSQDDDVFILVARFVPLAVAAVTVVAGERNTLRVRLFYAFTGRRNRTPVGVAAADGTALAVRSRIRHHGLKTIAVEIGFARNRIATGGVKNLSEKKKISFDAFP